MKRQRTPRTTLPCGCAHSNQRWVAECAKHAAESAEIGARWAADNKKYPWPSDRRANEEALR